MYRPGMHRAGKDKATARVASGTCLGGNEAAFPVGVTRHVEVQLGERLLLCFRADRLAAQLFQFLRAFGHTREDFPGSLLCPPDFQHLGVTHWNLLIIRD